MTFSAPFLLIASRSASRLGSSSHVITCLRSYFVCKFPGSGYVSSAICNMASKTSRTTNFSEQENLLLAELVRDFPEVESKDMTLKRWQRGQRRGGNFN